MGYLRALSLAFVVLSAACSAPVGNPAHTQRPSTSKPPSSSTNHAPHATPPGVGVPDSEPLDPTGGAFVPSGVDDDQDGLDDGIELQMAQAYQPFLSTHPDDKCPLSGLLVRVRPHPSDPRFINIVYDRIYQADCGVDGIGAHPGDDEVFGVTIDPTVAAPAGIVSIVAISHQGTICERDTVCGACPGLAACDVADVNGQAVPIVYSSKDKHASVVQLSQGCNPFGTCLDRCELATSSTTLPIVNAGEPDHPLTTDLTDQGFITTANGWTDDSLFHFDPWSGNEIGTAGVVSDDLVDPSFLAPVCPAPGSQLQ